MNEDIKQNLQAVIDYVWNSTESDFYRTFWGQAGITKKPTITSTEDLATLPILTKAAIQTYQDPDTRCYLPHSEKRCLLSTSGTSGNALFTWRYDYHYAPYTEEILAAGGERHLHTWSYHRMAPISVLAGYRTGLTQLNADPRQLSQFEALVCCFKPDSIAASPSVLLYLYDHISDQTLFNSLRFITLQGEPLSESTKTVIENHFPDASIYNVLGMSEAGCDIGFNTNGCSSDPQIMHVADQNVYAEILPDSSLAITTLQLPHALPLIRYTAGDSAAWISEPCACGRETPRFTLLGRVNVDFVRTQGFEIRIDTLEHALESLLPNLEPIMHAEIAEVIKADQKQTRLSLTLVAKTGADVATLKTQAEVALASLPLSSQTTLQEAIQAGLFSAPTVTVVAKAPPSLKNKTIRFTPPSA